MARAKAGSWIKLVAGLVVGAAAPPLFTSVVPVAVSGRALLAVPLPDRPVSVHDALTNAVESHRRGDYETAAVLFQDVLNRQNDLTDAEKAEFGRYWNANVTAIEARREGGRQLRVIDRAVLEGRNEAANELLKQVQPNEPYLTAADKAKFRELYTKLKGKPFEAPATKPIELPKPTPIPVSPTPLPIIPSNINKPLPSGGVSATSFPINSQQGKPDLASARTKLQQARAQLNQANLDLAEKLAHETEKMGVIFPPAEDTPAKLLQDVAKARGDAKTLLVAARAAMGRQEFDAAEKYAKQSEAISGTFTFTLSSDSPSKVLKELAAIKSSPPANAGPTNTKPEVTASNTATPKTPDANVTTTSSKPATPSKTEEARALIRKGYAALKENKLAQAKQFAEQAKALKADLEWWEDTPDKLLGDIERTEAKAAPKGKVEPIVQTSATKQEKPANKQETPTSKLPTTKDEAVALVKTARALLVEGKFDEAQMSAMKARAVKTASWGYFEDSPDSVLKDIATMRAEHNKEESFKVLAEGRKYLEKNDWEGAQKAAYRAQGLHGPYKFWELGDRPDKLLADAQELRDKLHKQEIAKKDEKKTEATTQSPTPKTPAPGTQSASTQPPVTPERKSDLPLPPLPTLPQPNPPKPPVVGISAEPPSKPAVAVATPPSKPPVAVATPGNQDTQTKTQMLQRLSEARAAIQVGDLARAKLLADMAAGMKVALAPGDDSPTAVYLEIERVNKTNVSLVVGEQVGGLQPMQGIQRVQAVQTEVDAGKVKAKQLLAEARQLQKASKFAEARDKCLLAIKTGAAFGPDEDNPAQAVNEIATMAKHHVEALSAQATELANEGKGDPLTRYQRAEQMLQEAHSLAHYFGFDTATVALKLTWIQEVRAQAMGLPVPPAQPSIQRTALTQTPPQPPMQPTPAAPPVQATPDLARKGHELLDQARNELRASALVQARKLAMEAMREEYGVTDEAAAVLRSIDTEAFNQKAHEDKRTFDAALQAYNRSDFAHASLLLGAIDPRNLDAKRAERLREIIQTPAMLAVRSDSVVQTDAPKDANVLPNLSGGQPNDGGGRAHATDMPPTPEKDTLTALAGMRKVLFQKQYSEGIKAMNDAAEKCRIGEYDQGLDILKGYLAALETMKDLDANQIALLRKPVENRLRHFELMKVQDQFSKDDKTIASKKMDARNKAQLADEAKQKKVADLMKQCNALIKDGKIEEGYRLALVAQEMDPDNAAVAGLVTLAGLKKNLNQSLKNKKDNEDFFFDALTDTDRTTPYLSTDNPESIDLKRLEISKKRLNITQMIQRKSPAMLEMEHKLMTPANINIKDESLRQAIDDVSRMYGLNFWIDEQGLLNQGISLDRTVNLRLEGVMLKTAVELLLKNLNLSYVIKERHIEITTKENAKGMLVRATYSVTDLIVPVDNSIGSPATPMLPQANQNGPPTLSTGYGYTPNVPTPVTGSYSPAATGVPVGTPAGNSPFASENENKVGADGLVRPTKRPMYTREDALIKLITNTIEPNSWSDAGGTGTIDYFPMAGAMVINQTLDIQEQVADLLQALRRLQDQEVAIEIRMVTVDEDYYERIGLNFSMDISTNSRNNKFAPALLNGAFAPANQINSPGTSGTLNGLLAGITPAGTLQPDLSIPIAPNSFAPATPPFGGYQGGGVGGLALGLAFLSDIQVSMFLEAVAGDARSSISQSPRITLQNGQQAFISVNDTLETLVTGVQLQQLQNGQFVVIPQVQAFPNQVSLQLSAVITADRRFVRLSPNVFLQNISTGQPGAIQFPILLPIYPTLQPGEPGQAVVYTQFIQQAPRTSQIQIQTTVTVPDGGTVVMGGLKRMSEGRVEYGPPILSKIPYIDRLFRNVAYGRSGASILIMVTPRIIIQEEEEERATGFVLPQQTVP